MPDVLARELVVRVVDVVRVADRGAENDRDEVVGELRAEGAAGRRRRDDVADRNPDPRTVRRQTETGFRGRIGLDARPARRQGEDEQQQQRQAPHAGQSKDFPLRLLFTPTCRRGSRGSRTTRGSSSGSASISRPGRRSRSPRASSTPRWPARSLARRTRPALASSTSVYIDPHVRRAHIEFASEAMLGYSPPWLVTPAARDRRAARRLHRDHGRRRAGALRRPRRRTRRPGTHARTSSEASLALTDGLSNWTIVGFPNEGWARTVFGEPDVERLWAAVATAVRLDEPDPAAAWREHIARSGRSAPPL